MSNENRQTIDYTPIPPITRLIMFRRRPLQLNSPIRPDLLPRRNLHRALLIRSHRRARICHVTYQQLFPFHHNAALHPFQP